MLRILVAIAASIFLISPATAMTLVWTDWTSADTVSASGTMGGTSVSFSGNISPAAQTNGGINYWAVNSGIFTPSGAENPPPDADIVRLTGGSNTGIQTLSFGTAVTNPYMAIMSLGQPGLATSYVFDSPFNIVNQGAGYWGGSATALTKSGNTLIGNEGHGLIQFIGTFSSISWTVPVAENWHGFQIATASVSAVPLPASGLLLLAGFGGFGLLRRKNKPA